MRRKKPLTGVLQVKLVSAQLEEALSQINNLGISIDDLQFTDSLSCSFHIPKNTLPEIKKLCRKRGDSFQILWEGGMIQELTRMKSRICLSLCLLMLFILTLFLPTRIFFVTVQGNKKIPEREILAHADACGISFGASRREVRSEKVKNALLSCLDSLQWVGVNTSGCTAIISVRERTEADSTPKRQSFGNVVAIRDGYILSGTVTNGTALFSAGQVVKAGDVLISGFTDCGQFIQTSVAQGEVFAQTQWSLKAATTDCFQSITEKEDKRYKVSLLFRKKRINLWKGSGIFDSSCGRMYKEYYITLPGNFQLPIALCIEQYTDYELHLKKVLPDEAERNLVDFQEEYLTEQMIAGKIQRKKQKLYSEDGRYLLNGIYSCEEMIGREQ